MKKSEQLLGDRKETRGYWKLKEEALYQCFSTAGPRPGTGPWHQLYRVARGSPGICHFRFLSIFHEYMFYSGNILRRKIFVNVSEKLRPRCWPEETTICYKITLVQ